MLRRACPLAVALLAVGCSSRELPDDPAPPALATGIPAAAPGAIGASFDAPAPTSLHRPPSMKAPKHAPHAPPPTPLPPDPFGAEGLDEGEGGGPPAPPLPPALPKKPPKPKGLTL